MEELIDVYDADKNYLGITVPREGAFMEEGQFMLYTLAMVEDAQGRFLITQRSMDKHWAAGWWEVSGGCVAAGETSLQGVIREVREEVGLDVSGRDATPIYSYSNVDLKRGDNYIVDIYHFHLDFDVTDVKLQAEEAIDCRMATWEEITELNEGGTFLHYKRLQQALEAEGVL